MSVFYATLRIILRDVVIPSMYVIEPNRNTKETCSTLKTIVGNDNGIRCLVTLADIEIVSQCMFAKPF